MAPKDIVIKVETTFGTTPSPDAHKAAILIGDKWLPCLLNFTLTYASPVDTGLHFMLRHPIAVPADLPALLSEYFGDTDPRL